MSKIADISVCSIPMMSNINVEHTKHSGHQCKVCYFDARHFLLFPRWCLIFSAYPISVSGIVYMSCSMPDIIGVTCISVWYYWYTPLNVRHCLHVTHQCLTLLICSIQCLTLLACSTQCQILLTCSTLMLDIFRMSHTNVWHCWTVLQWQTPECDILVISDINVGHTKMSDIKVGYSRNASVGDVRNSRHWCGTCHPWQPKEFV